MSATVSTDPLVALFAEYRKQVAAFYAIPDEFPGYESEEAAVAATYGPASTRLCEDPPLPTSVAGVAEAIRYALKESAFIDNSAEEPLKKCLAFLDDAMSRVALAGLINAYVEAQRVNHEAMRAVGAAENDDDKEAAEIAQNEAAQGEDDALTAICASRPASDFERSWRADFLKNIFRQEGGQEPTDEQMETMIDAVGSA